jgi:hypothetical protein
MNRNHRILLAVVLLTCGLGVGLLLTPRLSHAPYEATEHNIEPEVVSPETSAFKAALESELTKIYGADVKGYEPEKILTVFPLLKSEDFSGVEAVIGVYEFSNGTTTYVNSEITDGSADDISLKGYETLRNNIYSRLQLDSEVEALVVLQKLKGDTTKPTTTPLKSCPQDAKICPDGSSVGREGENCEFSACPVATEEVRCKAEQRGVAACIELYAPVCGAVEVQCVTTPCNPIPQTFSNSCFACSDERVTSYKEGACIIAVQ